MPEVGNTYRKKKLLTTGEDRGIPFFYVLGHRENPYREKVQSVGRRHGSGTVIIKEPKRKRITRYYGS